MGHPGERDYPVQRGQGYLQIYLFQKQEIRTVSGGYFLYLLMLHVLPRGLRKSRCYGFLHIPQEDEQFFATCIADEAQLHV